MVTDFFYGQHQRIDGYLSHFLPATHIKTHGMPNHLLSWSFSCTAVRRIFQVWWAEWLSPENLLQPLVATHPAVYPPVRKPLRMVTDDD